MAQLVKTCAGLAIASVKTVNGLAIAAAKTIAGLDNTSGGGGGAFTFVSRILADSSAEGAGLDTVIAKTVTGVTAGSLVVAWVKGEGPAATITLSDGTTSFTGGTQVEHSNGDLRSRFLYLPAAVASGSVTYTGTFSVQNSFRSLILMEFTYTGTCGFDVQSAVAGGSSGTSVTSGSMSTSADTNHVILGGYGEYSANTLSSAQVAGSAADGLFQLSATNATGLWRKAFTSGAVTGSATATLSGSASWICNGIAFKTT